MIRSRSDLNSYSEASIGGGGLAAFGDSDATSNLDYTTTTTVAGALTAFNVLSVEARTIIDGYAEARARMGGLGVSADANDDGDSNGVHVGLTAGSTKVVLQNGALLTGNEVVVLASVDALRGIAISTARATALGADSDAGASVKVRGSTEVDLQSGSTIVGNVGTTIRAVYGNVDVYAKPRATCSCGGGDTDARANADYDTTAKVKGRPAAGTVAAALIRTADLTVDATQHVLRYDRDPSRNGGFFDGGGSDRNPNPNGYFPRRLIFWEPKVIMLGEPNPVLEVDATGRITKIVNVVVHDEFGGIYDGDPMTAHPGVGATIAGGRIIVQPIIYDRGANARLFTNQPMDGDPPNPSIVAPNPAAPAAPRSEIWGNADVFEFQETWDFVRIFNDSSKQLETSRIVVVNLTGMPTIDLTADFIPEDGDENASFPDPLDDDTRTTFDFDIEHTFPPTWVEIRNRNATPGTPDIVIDGSIENPIGKTTIDNDRGDVRAGSDAAVEVIRTNILELDATGSIGEQGAVRRPLWIELVIWRDVSDGVHNIVVTANAGDDLVLDLTANRRSEATLGAALTVPIASLRAGDDVDVVLNDSKEGNDLAEIAYVRVDLWDRTPNRSSILIRP